MTQPASIGRAERIDVASSGVPVVTTDDLIVMKERAASNADDRMPRLR